MLIVIDHETGWLVMIQEKETLSAPALQFMNVKKKNFIFTKGWNKTLSDNKTKKLLPKK